MAYDTADKADWLTIDPAALPASLANAYAQYKAAYKLAKDEQAAFEALMETSADLPPTKRMVFGYRFGKLSIAIVANDRPAKSPTKPTMDLASFLRAASLNGTCV